MKKEEQNQTITLCLFKLKGDAKTYIIGQRNLEYIDSYKIKNPLFLEATEDIPLNTPKIFYPCNLSYQKKIDYSILIEKSDILFELQQDFIPYELFMEYYELWFRR